MPLGEWMTCINQPFRNTHWIQPYKQRLCLSNIRVHLVTLSMTPLVWDEPPLAGFVVTSRIAEVPCEHRETLDQVDCVQSRRTQRMRISNAVE
ncbi:hypothetical protein D3C75_922300 [compost metagenome]